MKIGKNNFRPPPAVESSVVRIVPKVPKPGISYEEWDGLLRVCFVRKNRTLRAGFLGTSKVMEGLEAGYRTWCAEKGVPLEEEPMEETVNDSIPSTDGEVAMDMDDERDEDQENEEAEEWGGIMDVDDDDDIPDYFKVQDSGSSDRVNGTNPKRKKKGKTSELVREKVRRVLEDKTDLADKRARMCDEADFLKLLWEFNQEGIHFV